MTWPEDYVGKILNMDCLDAMRDMPDKCVDLVLTSPPYNFNGFNRDGRVLVYDTIRDNMEDADYRGFISEILNELARLVKDGGVLCWNHKGKYENWEFRHPYWVIDLCPLPLYQDIIWKFPSGPDVALVKFYPRTEHVFIFSKGKPALFNAKYAKKTDVWQITHECSQKVRHPAPFPIQLALNCIGALSDESATVLDPFLGSGTTAIAAAQLGRKFIGIEISPEYCRIAEERLKRETAQTNMFLPPSRPERRL